MYKGSYNIDIQLADYHWWDDNHPIVLNDFIRNGFSLLGYRFFYLLFVYHCTPFSFTWLYLMDFSGKIFNEVVVFVFFTRLSFVQSF